MSEPLLPPSLSPAEVRLIEQICDRFEAAWKAGQRPPVEEYLDGVAEPLRTTLLGQLLSLHWEYRLRAGEQPHTADYAAHFPGARTLIEAVGREVAAADVTVAGMGTPAAISPTPRRLGEYRILREVGRGGMGVVYEALQESLGRRVALKVLPATGRGDPTALERFRREAQTTARLHHPHIVQIFEVGEQDDHPFLALEFIAGPSLAERLREAPQPPRQTAALVETLARTMHYAHQHGIVHRDLKPANVLLATVHAAAADGAAQAATSHAPLSDYTPKITDFGLAQPLAGTDLTSTGVFVGTPAYMAPEQAWGKSRHSPVGPAADVYALGAVLYECLTGRPPFKAATPLETVMLVVSEEPVPPGQLQPGLPRDLETICLKCLEKAPDRRYTTAAELAEDLRRFQADESITARPAGRLERAIKWARRRPATAALLGVSAAAAVIVLGVVVAFSAALVGQNRDLERSLKLQNQAEETARLKAREAGVREAEALSAKKEAEEQKQKADKAAALARKQRDQARGHLFTTQLLKVAGIYETDEKKALDLLHDYDACPIDLRDAAWRYYDNACRGEKPIPLARGDRSREAGALAFSPDGTLLASAGAGRAVQLWEATTGKLRTTLKGDLANVLAVTFSPDGKMLAVGCEDGSVRLWDVALIKQRALFTGHEGGVFSVVFRPDGQVLASIAKNDKRVQLWDTATGKGHRTLELQSSSLRFVAFSPDGKILATGGEAPAVRLSDTATGKEIAILRQGERTLCGAFCAEEHTLAWAGSDKSVRLWDTAMGRELAVLKHEALVSSVAISRDGKTVASGDDSGAIRLWEAATGKERAVLRHAGAVISLAFSRDGYTLASAASDGTARLWTMAPGPMHAVIQGHRGDVRSVAFSANGLVLASAGGLDGTARLWNVATGQEHTILRGHAGLSVAFGPDSHTLATGGSDGVVRLWDVDTGQMRTLPARAGPSSLSLGVAFSPDRKTLASTWSRFDVQEQKHVSIAVKLWDIATGKERATLDEHSAAVCSMVFSPDGDMLASGSLDGTVRLWEVATSKLRAALPGRECVSLSLALSRDGKTLASAHCFDDGKRGEVKLWEVSTARVRATLEGYTGGVWSVAFSPDGKTLASADEDQTVRLWDVPTRELRDALEGHSGRVYSVAFRPDGKLLASGDGAGAVRLWQAP